MQPIYEWRVTIEVELYDSVSETQQAIEASLSGRGQWASWVVIDTDIERQTIFVEAIVVDQSACKH
jgi:hypothetical protein